MITDYNNYKVIDDPEIQELREKLNATLKSIETFPLEAKQRAKDQLDKIVKDQLINYVNNLKSDTSHRLIINESNNIYH